MRKCAIIDKMNYCGLFHDVKIRMDGKEGEKSMQPKYKRVLLKLSGEALAGDQRFGLNHEVIAPVVEQIVQIHNIGCNLVGSEFG